MAAIKGSHTKPELVIRRAMHAAGLRFRLHAKELPGKPDLVFPRYKAVVFVNGCFWHRHDCHLFRWPTTREEFWREKIARNVVNDQRSILLLREQSWRTATIWECALKGRARLEHDEAMQQLVAWIKSEEESFTIRGQ
jgi:DNA mismatch endonuclease, patch repair protein